DHLRMANNPRTREVADVIGDFFRFQRGKHGFLVDHPLASEVEDHGALPYILKVAGIYQFARCIQKRHMEADEVSILQNLVDAVRLLYLRGKAPGGVNRD